MKKNTGKRILSGFLCVLMVVSVLPVSALALELPDLDVIQNAAAVVAAAEEIVVEEESVEEVVESPELDESAEAIVPREMETLKEELEEETEQKLDEAVVLTGNYTFVNPLYADIVSEDELFVSASYVSDAEQLLSDDAECYTTVDEAAAYLRARMVARDETITVLYQAEEIDFNAEIGDLIDSILETAQDHTGVPDEGDYIRWQYVGGGANVTAEVTGTTYNMAITYTMTYYTTAEEEQSVTDAVQILMDRFAFTEETSDYAKAKAIYDCICTYVQYDYDHLEDDSYTLKYTAYAAVINECSVCQGYALLFYRLALEAGLDARIVAGMGDGEAHSWNIVKLGDVYYYLDATWDAGASSYSWFLKGADEFSLHILQSMNGIDYAGEDFWGSYPLSDESFDEEETCEGPYTEGDYTYTVLAGEATITEYSGTETDVVVPAELGGYPVTAVAREAFCNNDSMVTLTLGEGLESIAKLAIVGCDILEKIYLSSTVVVPMCSAVGLDGDSFVFACPMLRDVEVSEENEFLTSRDGVLYSEDMTCLLLYPYGKTQDVFVVPEGVVRIRDGACSYNPYVKEIVLPDSLIIMGYFTFEFDYALERVNIPENCEFIGQFAFSGTSIKELYIPASLTVIMADAFFNTCSLETIEVDPDNPVYYSEGGVLFHEYDEMCTLICYPAQKAEDSYTLPDGVVIARSSFSFAKNLKSIQLSDSMGVVPYNAFYGCASLVHVVIPDGVITIDEGAFMECRNLATIQIPSSVTSIDSIAFANIDYLIITGEIGSYAEKYAVANGYAFLETGTMLGGSGSCGENVTWELKDGVLTIAGSGSMADFNYRTEIPWDIYRKLIKTAIIEEGVTTIADYAFSSCTALESVRFPETLVSIGRYAFASCFALNEMQLPDSLESLRNSAFDFCKSLKRVQIPGNVTNWEYSVFSDCSGLENVIIEDGVPYIGAYAFENCISLTSVQIPQSMIRIEGEAFANCSALVSTKYYGAETEWNSIDIWWNNDDLYPVEFNARPGDVTGDGYVEIVDMVRLMKYIAGDTESVNQPGLDPNGDSTTDIQDIIRLIRWLAGEDVELK